MDCEACCVVYVTPFRSKNYVKAAWRTVESTDFVPESKFRLSIKFVTNDDEQK